MRLLQPFNRLELVGLPIPAFPIYTMVAKAKVLHQRMA